MTLDRTHENDIDSDAAEWGEQRIASASVAIISDTHGHLDERIAALIERCDYAVHAGDILDANVIEAMRPKRHRLCVAGNNDRPARWPGHQANVCATLPHVAKLGLPGGLLVAEHGDRFGDAPSHAQLRAAHPQARVIVYGHTHRLICDTDQEPWVLNPGAAGRTRNRGGASCLILEAGVGGWSVQAHRFTD